MKKLLIGCLSLLSTVFACSREPIRCRLMDEIIASHAKNQRQQNQLIMIGSGGGAVEKVERFNVHFTAYDKKIDVAEARKLFVEGVEELLNKINTNKQIRPYLYTYPFTENDLKYRIGFDKREGGSVESPNVAFVFIAKGTVFYDKYDFEKRRFETIHKEPYQEALRIVKGSRSKQEYR